jgi:hypothetical protein
VQGLVVESICVPVDGTKYVYGVCLYYKTSLNGPVLCNRQKHVLSLSYEPIHRSMHRSMHRSVHNSVQVYVSSGCLVPAMKH